MNRKAVLAIAVSAGAVAVCASGTLTAFAARPGTQTLHFYQVVKSTQFYNAAGREIKVSPPETLPAAGDWVDEIDNDYAGSFAHHATQWTATDQLLCTFTSSQSGECYVQFAIGGSLLALNHIPAATAGTGPEKISVGTGVFGGLHGILSATQLKNGNSNVVIKLS